jgi:large repetitive protein
MWQTAFVLIAGRAAPKPTVASFNPSAGKVASQVTIHGSHFVRTTAVTFGGVSAKVKVLNTGNITASVPAGASTGPIAITNKGGTTLSNNNFDVQ